MIKNVARMAGSAWVAVILTGCASLDSVQSQAQSTNNARDRMEQVSGGHLRIQPAELTAHQMNRVRVHQGSYLTIAQSPSSAVAHLWLTEKKVSLTVRGSMTVDQVIASLVGQGIKITSNVPLAGVVYKGLGVKEMDASSAIRVLFGSVGLDIEVDDANQTVVLVPLQTKTWYLGISNRKSSFRTGTRNTGAVATQAGGAGASSSAIASSVQDQGQGSIEVTGDFWKTLKDDIKGRMTVLLPRMPVTASMDAQATLSAQGMRGSGPMPMPMPTTAGGAATSTGQSGATGQVPPPVVPGQTMLTGVPVVASAASASSSMSASVSADGGNSGNLERIEMGTAIVNEETGVVSVRAPAWLLAEIDGYITKIIDSANTTINFVGEILSVETNSAKSEGLDISAFARFAAGRYGAVIRNNALDGVTLSFPTAGSAIPSLTTSGSIPGSNALMGVTSAADGLAIFNAYLSQFGSTKVIQRPVVSTTSSVPGEFKRVTTRFYNNVSQQAAAGGAGSAAVGTTNTLIPVEVGTMLRIVPLYNPGSRTIRAQIGLQQSVQTGVQTEPQLVTVGSSIQTIPTEIPIISRMSYSGETVLRDGDLIIVGGMVEDSESDTNSGVLGTERTPLSPITRRGNAKMTRTTYYVALRVAVEKKE